MPCYDPRVVGDLTADEAKAELDKLTRLLCEACKMLIWSGAWNSFPTRISNELKEWLSKHEKDDAKRCKDDS